MPRHKIETTGTETVHGRDMDFRDKNELLDTI